MAVCVAVCVSVCVCLCVCVCVCLCVCVCVFPCYKNNREESYCPYIMTVNDGQNRA